MDHGLPFLVNCSIMFTELPLRQRPAAVGDAGAQLVGLNFAAGDMPAGDRGLVSWPGREPEFLDSVHIATSIGKQLGTSAFNALYGNRMEQFTAERQDEVALENLNLPPQKSVRR